MTVTAHKLVLVVEPDASIASILTQSVESLSTDAQVQVVQTAEQAIEACDAHTPAALVTELMLADHSAMGLLYELRSYADWLEIPVIVYTQQKLSADILASRDWKLLNISQYLYKPDTKLQQLTDAIAQVL